MVPYPAFLLLHRGMSHGGVAMTVLQAMLLQVNCRKSYLSPAWPTDGDAHFKLHVLYTTTVKGELRGGKATSLKVTPELRAADVVNMLAIRLGESTNHER